MGATLRSAGDTGSVFISYAHEDRRFLRELRVHLKPLERRHGILVWADTDLKAGSEWRKDIAQAIAGARVAVLMVSAHFFASDFIQEKELPPLLKGAKTAGVGILPIIARTCAFEDSELTDYQTLPSNTPERALARMSVDQRDGVYTQVADFIKKQLEKPAPRPPKRDQVSGRSPTQKAAAANAPQPARSPARKAEAAKSRKRPSPGKTGRFTKAEWTRIRRELERSPVQYGLPQPVFGSVVIGSFNIRKLGRLDKDGSVGRDELTMEFLATICRRFDLLAIQEVMPDTSGIRRLCELMGPDYELAVSDVTGVLPGLGMGERLAFVYNRKSVRRTPAILEVTTSRAGILRNLALHHREIFEEMEANETARSLREYHRAMAGRRKPKSTEPELRANVNTFLQFSRTPLAVGFEVQGLPGSEPLTFLCLNAHLQFGRPMDRQLELTALLDWISAKLQAEEFTSILLFGDLNLDFDAPRRDLQRIATRLLAGFRDKQVARRLQVGFPFVFPHPQPRQDHPLDEVFRSNVSLMESYDQIGLFSLDPRLKRLATGADGHTLSQVWGVASEGPDYGVMNFTDLFSHVLNKGRSFKELDHRERMAFRRRFEFSVSDHMPIWLRLPLPSAV